MQNHTISTMQILLHSRKHHRKWGRWEFGESKLIFIAINPLPFNMNIHLLWSSFRFIPCVFCMIFHGLERDELQNKLFMWGLVLYTRQTTQQPTVDWNAFKSQWCLGLIILLWIANIITAMCGIDNFIVNAKNIIMSQSIQHNNQPFVCCQVLPLLFDFW